MSAMATKAAARSGAPRDCVGSEGEAWIVSKRTSARSTSERRIRAG